VGVLRFFIAFYIRPRDFLICGTDSPFLGMEIFAKLYRKPVL
jgi:hypothetical protein